MKHAPRPYLNPMFRFYKALTTNFMMTLVVVSLLAEAPAARAGMTRLPESFLQPVAELSGVPRVEMPSIDVASLKAQDARRPALRGGLFRFATAIEVSYELTNSGRWEVLADGSRLWRLRIVSPGALSLNLGLLRFDMPSGTGLWIYSPDGEHIEGPYTAEHRNAAGQLWTSMIATDELLVEVHVPVGASEPQIEIGRVNHGYRFFGADALKQGTCQNDVVCSEGNGWRKQIRSVGWYSVEGVGACTGSLVNSRDSRQPAYFLSAEHCEITRSNASTMVVYWNYESPTCGRLSGGNLSNNQSGATLRAAYRPSDFVLVELDRKPDAGYRVHYAGWDATGRTPSRVVGVHHPNLDEKSISFENDGLLDDGTHWEVAAWDDGTTEPGSSGSCIFNNAGLCVGTLTGGYSECGGPAGPDYYGKMSVHWSGGGSRNNRLRDWLDPAGTGQRTLAGSDPIDDSGGGDDDDDDDDDDDGGSVEPGDCASPNILCLQNNRFQVSVDWSTAAGQSGQATEVPVGSDDSGLFWFFSPDNWEMLVKVLDGCDINQHKWVFSAATTDTAYTLRVLDTSTGRSKTYFNPPGAAAAATTDTSAFASCP